MDFRGVFKAEAPFMFDIVEDDAYRRIDECRKKYVLCLSLFCSVVLVGSFGCWQERGEY
jgi:hypothetical protein